MLLAILGVVIEEACYTWSWNPGSCRDIDMYFAVDEMERQDGHSTNHGIGFISLT